MLRSPSDTVCPSRLPGRQGFTMIEAIIVMGILSLLMSLLLPAVQQVRSTSRKLQCKNNLRHVAMALIAFTESNQSFPASGYFGMRGGDYHSWVVSILPWIDQNVIYDKWDFTRPFNGRKNFKLGNSSIPVLVCPDDQTAVGKGDLSFVANGGFGWTGPPCGVITPSSHSPIDLNGSGLCTRFPIDGTPSDRELLYKTGLMFCENWPEPKNSLVKKHSLASVRDGLSNTLMLAENIHSGYDPNGNHGNWASPLCWRNCFFVSGHICAGFTCTSKTVDFAKANDKSQLPNKLEAINPPFQTEGITPWPTSFHKGGVNTAFCDGSVRFLSENLDGRAYFCLVTPQGLEVKGPLSVGSAEPGSF
jgi:prepilin-type N-terminal cleavage/methylation domain-containing protein/prepilin-type processing-associated H-X9-DG protein